MATIPKPKSSSFRTFIAGVITGLIIAIIISFIANRTISSPGQKSKSDSTQVADANSQPSDPNQSLYGKETPKPAATTTPAATPATTATAASGVTSPAAAPVAQPAAPAPAATVAAPAAKPAEEKTVYIQAGAFRNRTEAENMRGNLALSGFESQVTESSGTSGSIFRVRLGPYKGTAAEAMQKKLKQNGFITTITHAGK